MHPIIRMLKDACAAEALGTIDDIADVLNTALDPSTAELAENRLAGMYAFIIKQQPNNLAAVHNLERLREYQEQARG